MQTGRRPLQDADADPEWPTSPHRRQQGASPRAFPPHSQPRALRHTTVLITYQSNRPRRDVSSPVTRAGRPSTGPGAHHPATPSSCARPIISPLLVPSGAQRVSSEHAVSSLPRAPRLRVNVRGRRAGRPPRGRLHLWLLSALHGYASDVGEQCCGEWHVQHVLRTRLFHANGWHPSSLGGLFLPDWCTVRGCHR